jgi:hypothetical protein
MQVLLTGQATGIPHSLFNPLRSVHFEGDDGAGNGNGGGNPAEGADAIVAKLDELLGGIKGMNLPVDVLKQLTSRAEAAGKGDGDDGWKAYALALADQAQKAREKLRQITGAQKGALIVTDQEEIDALAAAKSLLGEAGFKGLVDRLKLATKLEGEAAERETLGKLDEIAEGANLNAEALKGLPGMAELAEKIKATTMKVDGKDVTTYTIEQDGKSVDLREHLQTIYKPFWSVLNTEGQQDASGANGTATGTQPGMEGTAPAPGFTVPHTPAVSNQGGNGNEPDFLGGVLGPVNSANATPQQQGNG